MSVAHALIAILPCNDLDASEAFYAKLGFQLVCKYEKYRILRDPCGLYLYTEDVDELAAVLAGLVTHAPENKPWGTYEFAVCDPDGTLVRVGRPVHKT